MSLTRPYLRLVISAGAAVAALSACSATPGPDKSLAGAVLGAGWGAGAGAIIGNQVNDTGPGAMVGSAFGAGAGLLTGIGLDVAEGQELESQREIDALRVQVASNQAELRGLVAALDDRHRSLAVTDNTDTVYFDDGSAALHSGAVQKLERFVESVRFNPYFGGIEVHGHSDDTGDAENNRRLSESRARSVAEFFGAHGVSMNQIKLYAHGSARPQASNTGAAGRQLNRRVEIYLIPAL